jgi:hypothetical protein
VIRIQISRSGLDSDPGRQKLPTKKKKTKKFHDPKRWKFSMVFYRLEVELEYSSRMSKKNYIAFLIQKVVRILFQ